LHFCWSENEPQLAVSTFFCSAGHVAEKVAFPVRPSAACDEEFRDVYIRMNFCRVGTEHLRLALAARFIIPLFSVASFPSVSIQSFWRAGRRARVVGEKKESKTFWSHLSHIPGARGIAKIHERNRICHIQQAAGLEE
jgi:hypothetical protein